MESKLNSNTPVLDHRKFTSKQRGVPDRKKQHKKRISTNRNLIKRVEYPDTLYLPSNSRNWDVNNNYKFFGACDTVTIIPVFGLETVGGNCTVIETEEDLIIIDLGIAFPEEGLLGIDGVVPDLSFLTDKINKIRGIVITHGHMDHIGGLPFLYHRLGSPLIFAPKLAGEMIKEKFEEARLGEPRVQFVDGDSIYHLGKFRLSHFKVNHTIMDNYGVCIDTPVGRIVHTSDYKFDLTPYKESPSDYSKLSKIGDEGVLLLLDESTNSKFPGWSPSETAIAYDLENTIRDARGRLIIGLFSTMITRVKQISELAQKYGKKVSIIGKSLSTNVKIAHRLGYINVDSSTFIPLEEINKYSDDSVVIVATGSQGEPNAALMKIAIGENKKLKFKPSDTVVFSSSKIPGNELKINNLINLISEKGCKVITSEYVTLHATGHGFSDEHKLMVQLTKPKFIMPIHGEQSMLIANRENVLKLGFPKDNIIMCKDGDIVELRRDKWEITGNIKAGVLWVEGNVSHKPDTKAYEERKMMSQDGIVFCVFKVRSENQALMQRISVYTRGIMGKTRNILARSIPRILTPHDERIKEYISNNNTSQLKETIQGIIRRYIQKEMGQNPLVEVILI